MENKEKQTTEEPKDKKLQVTSEPVAETLSETELDKVAGGKNYYESRSNIS